MAATPVRPDLDPALARLAEKGARQLAASRHTAAAANPGEENIRRALSGLSGRQALAILGGGLALAGVLSAIVFAVTQSGSATAAVAVAAGISVLVFIVVRAAIKASPTRIAKERLWVAALPFTLEGYFETLARNPDALWMTLSLTPAWQNAPPDPALLASIVAAVDARTGITEDMDITVKLECSDESVISNTDVVSWTRTMVTRVLVPLHTTCPLTKVRLKRTQ